MKLKKWNELCLNLESGFVSRPQFDVICIRLAFVTCLLFCSVMPTNRSECSECQDEKVTAIYQAEKAPVMIELVGPTLIELVCHKWKQIPDRRQLRSNPVPRYLLSLFADDSISKSSSIPEDNYPLQIWLELEWRNESCLASPISAPISSPLRCRRPPLAAASFRHHHQRRPRSLSRRLIQLAAHATTVSGRRNGQQKNDTNYYPFIAVFTSRQQPILNF